MSGFGDFGFEDFSFGSAAEEDPYGISSGRKSREWWLNEPYGAKRKKSGGSPYGGASATGAWQGTTTRKTDSVYPNMGPDPSTTQRAILEAKQKQEDATRIFGGGAAQDPGAGGGDFDLGGGGVLKYHAPDLTNPGHQDAARQQMDISLQDYNDYFNNKEEIKRLEDEAYALPKRTGFWGSLDRKRDAAYQRAEVLRRRNAEIRAGNPKAFGGGEAGGYDPNRYATVGNLRFDNLTGKYIVPDEATLTAMHRSSSAVAGKTAAPHLETLIEPRTGKTVRVNTAAVPQNAQGQLVDRWFERDPKLQGPTQPGVDSLGETKEEPYGVPDTAAETAAASRERIAKEKAAKSTDDHLTAANRIAISGQKRQVDAEIGKQKTEIMERLGPGPKREEALAALETERKRQYDRIDADTAPAGGGKTKRAGTTRGVRWSRVGD